MEPEEDGRADGSRLMRDLPPMPKPDLSGMRGEATMGCVSVCMLIALFVGGAHGGVVLMDGKVEKKVPILCLVLVYLEALVAIGCLIGLMLSDPGVVKRSEETCLPLPPEVATSLREGEAVPKSSNIKDPDGLRTYCVRCYVWRSPPLLASVDDDSCQLSCATACPAGEGDGRFHHCSTCQRCVAHFDHHCGFFGRCIAGKGLEGNMIYFRVIIGMAVAGGATAGGTLVVGLMKQGGSSYWLGIALAAYLGMYLVVSVVSITFFLCMQCWRRITVKSPLWLGISPYKYRRTEFSGDLPPPRAEEVQPTVVGVADQL